MTTLAELHGPDARAEPHLFVVRLDRRFGRPGARWLIRALGRQGLAPIVANGTSLERQQGHVGLRLGDRQQEIAYGFESPIAGRAEPARNLLRPATDSSGQPRPASNRFPHLA